MVEQKQLLSKLDSEIASLESMPSEEERKQALDEIRQDYLELGSSMEELREMLVSTATVLTSLLAGVKDKTKDVLGEKIFFRKERTV